MLERLLVVTRVITLLSRESDWERIGRIMSPLFWRAVNNENSGLLR